MDKQREDTLAELEVALQELESNEGLTRFVAGHGIQSRLFAFEWREPTLEIDISLPYARVLSDEESQAADNAEIGAAIRMARLLLLAADAGVLLQEGEAKLSASFDEDGARYSVVDADEVQIDAGDDWDGLTARLEAAFPMDGGEVRVIWP